MAFIWRSFEDCPNRTNIKKSYVWENFSVCVAVYLRVTTKRSTMGTVSLFIVVIAASTFIGKTVSRLPLEDYDCKCSYFCPSWGVQGGQCWDNDYMMWGLTTHTYCCIPSFLDYDHPVD